jgi:hypothetical protein
MMKPAFDVWQRKKKPIAKAVGLVFIFGFA